MNPLSRMHYAGWFAVVLSLLLFSPGELMADQVIADDLIVTGSTCVGFGCVDGEAFSFDTIRLKEDNTRIGFDDTSVTAGFPNNDWELTANDSASGGANKFSLTDVTGAKTPFAVEAGARTNALYVDDGGRIGLGTNSPVLLFHAVKGDTPALRLEQDGSSGWTPQTWDIAGNESNFFVRDTTGGSKLPFRIRPGAPTSSIDIAANGNVGMGTASPSEDLHVFGSDGGTQLRVEETNGTVTPRTLLFLVNNGNPRIDLRNTTASSTWTISSGNTFNILRDNVLKLQLDSAGNLVITGQLTTAGTTCGGGCDVVFDRNFKVESIEDHAAKMWENRYLPAVGPTAENEPFNVTQKTGGMLNELEKAHIYIEQLHERLSEREAEMDQLSRRLEKLEKSL